MGFQIVMFSSLSSFLFHLKANQELYLKFLFLINLHELPLLFLTVDLQSPVEGTSGAEQACQILDYTTIPLAAVLYYRNT